MTAESIPTIRRWDSHKRVHLITNTNLNVYLSQKIARKAQSDPRLFSSNTNDDNSRCEFVELESLELVLQSRYQFVLQIIFLNSLFGYLSLLIIIKWCTGSQADLYYVMIYMFLSPFEDLGENKLLWGQAYFRHALIAVPWMLFPKPFILQRIHTEGQESYSGAKLQRRSLRITAYKVNMDGYLKADLESADFLDLCLYRWHRKPIWIGQNYPSRLPVSELLYEIVADEGVASSATSLVSWEDIFGILCKKIVKLN
ncbi:hypothetical protein CASFOL_033757 [Castilleja foliolosa]|uniref:V-type proton ATPase subunit a n=1 Tax=Castilleja foliolosa TaxID=1961234 RepID=A0ABD3BZI3_9LAMI